MSTKKISVIIPAYNEAEHIGKTIKKFREQGYDNLEIIVVDNSDDKGKTYEVSRGSADKVLRFPGPIGLSNARNEGAKVAEGEIFIFSDADSWLEPGGIKKIAVIAAGKSIVGSVLGGDEKNTLKGRIFFFFKNWIYRFKIYQGALGGVIFCSKDVFLKIGGFDGKKEPAEFQDFIKRAKSAAAEYKIITNCYAFTSMRRYEKNGYSKTILFWILWKMLYMFKAKNNLTENYYKRTKDV